MGGRWTHPKTPRVISDQGEGGWAAFLHLKKEKNKKREQERVGHFLKLFSERRRFGLFVPYQAGKRGDGILWTEEAGKMVVPS